VASRLRNTILDTKARGYEPAGFEAQVQPPRPCSRLMTIRFKAAGLAGCREEWCRGVLECVTLNRSKANGPIQARAGCIHGEPVYGSTEPTGIREACTSFSLVIVRYARQAPSRRIRLPGLEMSAKLHFTGAARAGVASAAAMCDPRLG